MVCSRPRARSPFASFSRDSCPPRQVSPESTWMMVRGRRKMTVALLRRILLTSSRQYEPVHAQRPTSSGGSVQAGP